MICDRRSAGLEVGVGLVLRYSTILSTCFSMGWAVGRMAVGSPAFGRMERTEGVTSAWVRASRMPW